MRVEVVRMVRYYADGFTLSVHRPGSVADIPDEIAEGFVSLGLVSPIEGREIKPEVAPIETKDDNRPRRRAGKSRRA